LRWVPQSALPLPARRTTIRRPPHIARTQITRTVGFERLRRDDTRRALFSRRALPPSLLPRPSPHCYGGLCYSATATNHRAPLDYGHAKGCRIVRGTRRGRSSRASDRRTTGIHLTSPLLGWLAMATKGAGLGQASSSGFRPLRSDRSHERLASDRHSLSEVADPPCKRKWEKQS
jgi:hypothetical protein